MPKRIYLWEIRTKFFIRRKALFKNLKKRYALYGAFFVVHIPLGIAEGEVAACLVCTGWLLQPYAEF